MTPVVLVTGLSGAGKASTLRCLEDLGYDAVDNPPLTLVETLAGRAEQPLAIGLDARSRGFDAHAVVGLIERLRANPTIRVRLVFLRAEAAVLLRRYTETRRRHPLAQDGRVADGIEQEVLLTEQLREHADLVVDTSELPLPGLRRLVAGQFGYGGGEGLNVTLMSFAFPAGLPGEADMVFDARFLRNPHYDPILRPRTGQDAEVAAFVEADPDFEPFFRSVSDLLKLVLPRFVQEGKTYATIAVGCTGGRHRSVRMVERLRPELEHGNWRVSVVHRELARAAGAVPAVPRERVLVGTPVGAPSGKV